MSDLPSRRNFLAATGVALAASAAPSPLFADVPPASKKIRLGIVGGRFGATFQFHEHPNCTVAAVSDLRPDRRAHLMKAYRCDKSYDSLEQLVQAPDLDAVAIFTPAPDHVRHATLAMKAGKHVLCAVPAAYSLDECHQLLDVVKSTGLTYMMAETSYYQQPTISARQFYKNGDFGRILYADSVYHHPGLEELFFENGKPTWRHGFPPMHYPTHCTAHLCSVTGERLTHVTCTGFSDDSPILKDNPYHNPFWNQTAMFTSNRNTPFRVAVWWRGAVRGTERAELLGSDMSFYWPHPNGLGPTVVRASSKTEKDSGGFLRWTTTKEPFTQPDHWKTDALPEPLRHNSGHEGSHTFLTHEFIDSLVHNRPPTINVHEALAYTAPGIVAHQSALKNGERLKIPQFDPVA
jgi:predicted dehydrogenase